MTCRELADFLMDYHSGELSDAARIPFEHHLSICPNCREYLQQYKDTVAAAQHAFAVSDEPVPPEVPDELVKAILAARRK